MTEAGSQLTVLQRVRNKNNIADLLFKRKVAQIERETTIAMSKIEMEKLDCKSFLKTLRSCDSDDMSEFAPLMSYTLGEEVGSSMKGRRTRFRDLFSTDDLGDCLPIVLDYRNIKVTGEKNRYKDLKRSRTLIELWTSKLNSASGRPRLERAQTDIPLGGDTSQPKAQEGTVNLAAGIITKMAEKPSVNKGSAFKKLPTPRSSFSNVLPTINSTAKNEANKVGQNTREQLQGDAALPEINGVQEKINTKLNLPKTDHKAENLEDHHAKKDKGHHGHGKDRRMTLHKKIEHFYQEIEPLMPKKEEAEHDWLLPHLDSPN